LTQVRAQTESLCAPLEVEDYVVSTMTDVSPTKWHLAHTSWFFETFVLAPFDSSYVTPNPKYAFLFNSYYVQAGERHCRAQRGLVTRPTVAEVYGEYEKRLKAANAMDFDDLIMKTVQMLERPHSGSGIRAGASQTRAWRDSLVQPVPRRQLATGGGLNHLVSSDDYVGRRLSDLHATDRQRCLLCRRRDQQVVKLDGKSDRMSPDKARQLPVDPEGTTCTDKLAVGSPPNATTGTRSATAKNSSLIKLHSLKTIVPEQG